MRFSRLKFNAVKPGSSETGDAQGKRAWHRSSNWLREAIATRVGATAIRYRSRCSDEGPPPLELGATRGLLRVTF